MIDICYIFSPLINHVTLSIAIHKAQIHHQYMNFHIPRCMVISTDIND